MIIGQNEKKNKKINHLFLFHRVPKCIQKHWCQNNSHIHVMTIWSEDVIQLYPFCHIFFLNLIKWGSREAARAIRIFTRKVVFMQKNQGKTPYLQTWHLHQHNIKNQTALEGQVSHTVGDDVTIHINILMQLPAQVLHMWNKY